MSVFYFLSFSFGISIMRHPMAESIINPCVFWQNFMQLLETLKDCLFHFFLIIFLIFFLILIIENIVNFSIYTEFMSLKKFNLNLFTTQFIIRKNVQKWEIEEEIKEFPRFRLMKTLRPLMKFHTRLEKHSVGMCTNLSVLIRKTVNWGQPSRQ